MRKSVYGGGSSFSEAESICRGLLRLNVSSQVIESESSHMVRESISRDKDFSDVNFSFSLCKIKIQLLCAINSDDEVQESMLDDFFAKVQDKMRSEPKNLLGEFLQIKDKFMNQFIHERRETMNASLERVFDKLASEQSFSNELLRRSLEEITPVCSLAAA